MNAPNGAHARRTLIKDVTGTCRLTSYDLPGKDTVYGIKQSGIGEGAQAVISELSVHQPSKPAISDQDIVKCNKMAVKNKLISAKDQYDFQLSHQHIKKSTAHRTMFDKSDISSKIKGPFGKASYPRSPQESSSGTSFKPPPSSISKVIHNEYGKKSTGQETYPDTSCRVVPGKMPPPKDTNSNRLKTVKDDETEKKPFVMKKFQNVPSRVFNNTGNMRGGYAATADMSMSNNLSNTGEMNQTQQPAEDGGSE